jgi:hypothetical protein
LLPNASPGSVLVLQSLAAGYRRLKDCSGRRDLVLDPFAGSGTTIIAAEKTGRRARAMEIDPHYCDVTVRRWQAYTGRRAMHVTTELPFEDTESQRGIMNDIEETRR